MRLIVICCMALTGAIGSPALALPTWHKLIPSFGGLLMLLMERSTFSLWSLSVFWGMVAEGCAIVTWPMAFVSTMPASFAAATLGSEVPFVGPAIWSKPRTHCAAWSDFSAGHSSCYGGLT
jgi:hypothetical protein